MSIAYGPDPVLMLVSFVVALIIAIALPILIFRKWRFKYAKIIGTIMGIVLFFVIFFALGTKLDALGGVTPGPGMPTPDIPATAEDPITTRSDILFYIKGSTTTESANVFNDEFEGPVTGKLTCTELEIETTTLSQSINSGEDKKFLFIIEKPRKRGTENCTIIFEDESGNRETLQKTVIVE